MAEPVHVIEVKRSLFNKIYKLNKKVEEIHKQHEMEHLILADNLPSMQVEIPAQMLKYAQRAARKENN
jgi:hypothetical protein